MAQIHLYFLDVAVTTPGIWVNLEPYIWMTSGFAEYGFASEWLTDYIKLASTIAVDGVSADGEDYTATTSLTVLRANTKYYLWDNGDKTLYVHFEDHKTPYSFDIIKVSQPLSLMRSPLSTREFDGYVDNKVYDNRLSNIPSVTDRLDDLSIGTQSYYSTTVSWDNTDGEFNLWASQSEIYGNYATLSYWGGDDIDDFDKDDRVVQWTGRVQLSTTGREISLQLIDGRKQFDSPSPENQVTWTNTGTSGDPVFVPEIWGNSCRIPCQCLTPEGPNGANFEFMVGLNTIALDGDDLISQNPSAVYVNGESVAFASASTTIDSVGIRYVTVASSVFGTTTYSNLENVTAEVAGFTRTGAAVNKAADIIKYKIEQHYEEVYNTTYFDTTNWAAAVAAGAEVSYYINTVKSFNQIIQDLTRADLGRFEISFDGLYRYFIFDISAAAVATFYKEQFLPEGFFPAIVRDPSRAISKFNVGRNRRYDLKADEAQAYVYDNYSDDFLAIERKTGVRKTVNFPTPISGSTDTSTAAFAEKMSSVFGKVYETTKITVKQQLAYDVFPGDFVNVEMDFPNGTTYLGTIRCEILGKIINTANNTTTLELRIV